VLAEEVREDGVAVIGLDPGFTRSEHVEQGQKDGLYLGWDISLAHSPDVPAAAVGHLCGCPDPLRYTGRNLSAPEIVAEHSLLPADAP
jgi:NAD(P)-dependent dehydrogenase (short-subunit alcohol dehydrogenase family)